MARLSEWDFFNRNVQSGLTEGQFMAAQYTLIAAGPPNLAFLTSDEITDVGVGADTNGPSSVVFPIGITQRFGLAHTRQHARVWEIGSERSYWITGRTVGQITLGRIIYHGPNLLRSLYAYYQSAGGEGFAPEVTSLLGENPLMASANANRNPHDVIRISPGYRNIFANLASDLFTQLMGLLIYFRDSNNESVFAAYAENCVIPSHSIGFDAGGTVIQENCQIQFERLVPIDGMETSVVPLIDINSSGTVSSTTGTSPRQTGRNF